MTTDKQLKRPITFTADDGHTYGLWFLLVRGTPSKLKRLRGAMGFPYMAHIPTGIQAITKCVFGRLGVDGKSIDMHCGMTSGYAFCSKKDTFDVLHGCDLALARVLAQFGTANDNTIDSIAVKYMEAMGHTNDQSDRLADMIDAELARVELPKPLTLAEVAMMMRRKEAEMFNNLFGGVLGVRKTPNESVFFGDKTVTGRTPSQPHLQNIPAKDPLLDKCGCCTTTEAAGDTKVNIFHELKMPELGGPINNGGAEKIWPNGPIGAPIAGTKIDQVIYDEATAAVDRKKMFEAVERKIQTDVVCRDLIDDVRRAFRRLANL